MTTMPSLAAAHLDHARRRTLDLLDGFDDHDLGRQVSPLMSPLVWDLAHIGHYEELWLLRNLAGAPPTDPHFDDVYDAFKHPRPDRPSLRILDPAGARAYLAGVRERVLEGLSDATLDGDADPLLANGFVYGMVVQHEHQHDETMLATIQLMEQPALDPALVEPSAAVPDAGPGAGEVALPGGPFVMGSDAEPWAYDNERPAHEVVVVPFRIDRTPVTNGAYAEFIADGGYDDPRLWTDTGWKWRMEADLAQPQFWRREGGRGAATDWTVLRYGQRLELGSIATQPVQHVCWYEADAYARWAGKRLPTETEWEYAASWGPDGAKRRYPWGDRDPDDSLANLGQTRLGPDAGGRRPGGASAFGVEQMVGDVWEWTASDFDGYPGFRSFPYREYSEVFFPDGAAEYKVLRGGSWATHPSAMRATFRNWDYPIRRQIFSGFRCAGRLNPDITRTVCRHLAYLGPPVDLASLLLAPPHSLVDQARAARFQQSGPTNPDGFGAGWYAAGPESAVPQRYRNAEPIWDDAGFPELAARTTSTAVLAAVRLASPGAPVEVSGNAPFVAGPWLFSLNGVVHRHFDGVGDELRATVSPRRAAAIEGVTDSEVLFAMTLDQLDAGASPAAALATTIDAVTTRTTGRLNLLLTDGHRIAATAWENSLFAHTATDGPESSTVITSEPLDDDPAWERIPDHSLVEVGAPGTCTVTPL